MPTYEYVCRACGHEFEEFQSIKADPIAVCPNCRKKKVERKIGIGGAVIFKGGGFYETDYRSDSYRSGEDAEKKASEAKAEGKSDGKSEGKSEDKSDRKAAGATDANARPDGKSAAGSAAHGADRSAAKSDGASPSKPDGKSGAKSDGSPASKSDAGARSDAATAAENKRIESRATHQARIGRGIGNIVGGAKKAASPKKPAPAKKRGRGK